MAKDLNLPKLEKLLALATQSCNEHEARNAAVLFCSLLMKSCTFHDLSEFLVSKEKQKRGTRYEQFVKDQRQARAEYDYKVRTVRRTGRQR